MSDLFNDVMQGLSDATAHVKGEETGAVIHEINPLDVKAIRTKVNMTQEEFARAVGVKLPTLRHWERGDRRPSGSAKVLLNLLSKEPQQIINMLQRV